MTKEKFCTPARPGPSIDWAATVESRDRESNHNRLVTYWLVREQGQSDTTGVVKKDKRCGDSRDGSQTSRLLSPPSGLPGQGLHLQRWQNSFLSSDTNYWKYYRNEIHRKDSIATSISPAPSNNNTTSSHTNIITFTTKTNIIMYCLIFWYFQSSAQRTVPSSWRIVRNLVSFVQWRLESSL